ncbi:Conserved protein containing a Zn-ribbon-like motif, possibly RNA-binding [Nocardia otitidiscaviarum]|uniref:Conserved protein containing a Zn-ribbon-like motif, possibly RNA-binding n=1 Tax=Nocardia otitidiscaviarum TaxID=1823 RepID=A0A379JH86_9NOCA|nr:ABATE domain-containing protein [Nocardia otitidiscaviarum]SUD47835.1 Conserved protein containing a Zn-ribbon-like motif, possibly RNA-binding [Nocardia otitidiscaviarum]
MTEVDFPILGTEPLPVEFANTDYGGGAERIDFLRSAEQIDRWFALVHPPAIEGEMGRAGERVRQLRDGVRHLLSAAADRAAPDPRRLDIVNEFARAAPTFAQLAWTSDLAPAARRFDIATGAPALLGRIATCSIELLTGPQSDALRRCSGPGCSLLFVKNHARRRWCHPSCGHRDRQARYYRRHHHPREVHP